MVKVTMFFGRLITICNQSFTPNTMVKLYSVAKPLLICGYHGLTIVTIVFGFILSETTVHFHKGCVVVCLSSL